MDRHEVILEFWFGAGSSALKPRRRWFVKDPAFDAEIRTRFLSDWELACRGELADWENARESCLALILVCNQFPRNLFRGDARAFSTNHLARAAARAGLSSVEMIRPSPRCSAGSCTCRSGTAKCSQTSSGRSRSSSSSVVTPRARMPSSTRTGASRSSSRSGGSRTGIVR